MPDATTRTRRFDHLGHCRTGIVVPHDEMAYAQYRSVSLGPHTFCIHAWVISTRVPGCPSAGGWHSLTPSATVELATDEGGGVGKQQLLASGVHGEEAAHYGAGAVPGAALTGPGRSVEGIESVVDRDLVAFLERPSGKDLHPVSHRARIAGVVEVAARRCEDSEPVESKFAEMDPFPLGGMIEVGCGDDLGVAPTEDELAFCERPARVDTATLRARVAYLDIVDHAAQPMAAAMSKRFGDSSAQSWTSNARRQRRPAPSVCDGRAETTRAAPSTCSTT